MPKISAIMALYNTPYEYLKVTLESILSQTFTDFELIIIDDASTVHYKEFFEKYNDERIKYFKLDKNMGPGHARNEGMKKAIGEYFAIVDSDDIYMPKRFELQADFLDKNPDISVLSGALMYSNTQNCSEVIENDEKIKIFLLFNSVIANALVMLRGNTFKEKNLFYSENIKYAEDYALWVDAMLAGVKIANMQDVLMVYTRRKNQLSKLSNTKKTEIIFKELYRKMFSKLGLSVTDNEIDLHYNLAFEKFCTIKNLDEVNSWFDKIIENNKKTLLFEEVFLINKKNEMVEKFDKKCCSVSKLSIEGCKAFIKNLFKTVDSKSTLLKISESRIKSGNPRLSAVMALYNTPYEYLKVTLESILSQTFTDFELIIIDDASTMHYKEFFEKYNDERIKYFKQEKNAGPGHARNVGINKATGEYVANVDSDDVYFPQRFERQIEFLDKNPDISIIGCKFRFSNRKKISVIPLDNKDVRLSMLFNSSLNNATIMFRKEDFVTKKLCYVEEISFGEDYELWIKAMFSGLKMANIEDFLMIYTRRSGQLSKGRVAKQNAILKSLYKKMFAGLGIDASQKELDLHHELFTGKFKTVKTAEQISVWFDKLIGANRENPIFDEEGLIEKKNYYMAQFVKVKNRLFKVKIGAYNLCLSKRLKIYIEERG